MTCALFVPLVMVMALPPSVEQKGDAVPRVFVHTEPEGQEDELEARRQSVKDLTAALAGKKKLLVLTESLEESDIEVEVIDRGVNVPRVVIGMGSRPGQPPGGNAPARTVILRVRLTDGAKTVELKNKNAPFESARGWKSAADDIARQIEKLIAHRGTVGSHDPD